MTNQDIQEYYFKEGCYIEEWLNSDQHEQLSIARVRVAAHTMTRLHRVNNTVERYVILSGQGTVTVDNKSWLVNAKDVVVIQPDQAQKIANNSHQDLIFLAICTPRFTINNYQDLDTNSDNYY